MSQDLSSTSMGSEDMVQHVSPVALAPASGLRGGYAEPSAPGFTPGPWEPRRAVQPDNVGGYDWAITAPGGAIIAEAFEVVCVGDARPVEANARLIAAAPEQHIALQGASDALAYVIEHAERGLDATEVSGLRCYLDAALAALAKATGEPA